MDDSTEYVTRLIQRLQRIVNDAQKCAEIMRHDQRINDVLLGWEEEQWEKDNPEEAEHQWESAGFENLERLLKDRIEENEDGEE